MKNLVIWRGPSELTGDPILVAVSGLSWKTSNPKTGDMLQTWILRSDMKPTDAIAENKDDAICGDCSMRGDGRNKRACYVVPWFGPLRVYKSLHMYEDVTPSQGANLVTGRAIRVGAYGDPTAVPLWVWREFLQRTSRWTGYTSQWKTCPQEFSRFLMASVKSEKERQEALKMGWRTYRILRGHESLYEKGEFLCPASNEAGHKTTCEHCSLCKGTSMAAKSVAIYAHGQRTRWLSENRHSQIPLV